MLSPDVVGSMNPQQARRTNSNVGVAVEVAVDLEGEGVSRDQNTSSRVRRGCVEDAVHQIRKIVGNKNLFVESPADEEDSFTDLVPGNLSGRFELWFGWSLRSNTR